MANFFDEIDMVYCLCIEQRKPFVINQFNKLGIMHKSKIIDAYTPASTVVMKTITDHCVYPIYTNNPIMVACSLGVRDIMIDIVKNKYNYAMVMEDDVVFLENMFEHGNKWITKLTISKHFNMIKPYVLYLQSSFQQEIFTKNNPIGGIMNASIRYGEPAYITNHIACSLLLKHLLPITSPFDEYKFVIKKYYRFQEAILVPYICRELSKNAFHYDTTALNHNFVRSGRTKKETVFNIMRKNNFYVSTNESIGYQKIISHLIKCINPSINIVINDTTISNNMMHYCVGRVENTLQNNYVISGTFSNINVAKNPAFIVSVRGKNSYDILFKRFHIKPLIGDILSLYSKYNPRSKNVQNKYCFIYDYASLKILCDDKCIFINPCDADIDLLLNAICSSEYVVSDNINYISIANSYRVPGIYAIYKPSIDSYYDIIAKDYYSNFTKNPVNPIIISCVDNTLIIDEKFINQTNTFIKPVPTINPKHLENLVDVLPFNFNYHKIYRNDCKYVQVIN
ncbi:putative ORFan [Tupanvirus deep ocean]|uniref:ORFan n=2 Tax=Tupanvirus TaxID=2094720 RepID=A0AC62A804_9VIRU|nr:putative ORFan [Tupanvirus deep ocean]QKU33910.1 putative ORFan [Tupanvirus deep ocean]